MFVPKGRTPWPKLRTWLLVAAFALGTGSGASAQTPSPCRTDSAQATWHAQYLLENFEAADPARMAEQGLPVHVNAVTPVADAAVCAAVLTAFNRRYVASDSVKRASRAFVFRVDTSLYVVTTSEAAAATGAVYILFTNALEWLAGWVEMR